MIVWECQNYVIFADFEKFIVLIIKTTGGNRREIEHPQKMTQVFQKVCAKLHGFKKFEINKAFSNRTLFSSIITRASASE